LGPRGLKVEPGGFNLGVFSGIGGVARRQDGHPHRCRAASPGRRATVRWQRGGGLYSVTIPARGRRGHPRTLGTVARPPARGPSDGEESAGGAAGPPGTLRSLIKSRGGGERGGRPRGRGRQPPGTPRCRRRALLPALHGGEKKRSTKDSVNASAGRTSSRERSPPPLYPCSSPAPSRPSPWHPPGPTRCRPSFGEHWGCWCGVRVVWSRLSRMFCCAVCSSVPASVSLSVPLFPCLFASRSLGLYPSLCPCIFAFLPLSQHVSLPVFRFACFHLSPSALRGPLSPFLQVHPSLHIFPSLHLSRALPTLFPSVAAWCLAWCCCACPGEHLCVSLLGLFVPGLLCHQVSLLRAWQCLPVSLGSHSVL